jgi:uncharacterized protein
MENLETRKHLTIGQCIGISGIMIAASLLFSPVMFLSNYIGKELSMFIYYIAAIGVTSWIAYIIRRKTTGKKSFNWATPNDKILPFIIIGTIALLFGVTSPITELIPMPEVFKNAFMEFGKGKGIFPFLLIVVAAPILEELIFRGIMLDGLLEKHSPLKSILITSALFGIVHLNPWQFVAAMGLGCFSGWIYYHTRNLTFSILIHATNNFCGYAIGKLSDESSMDKTSVELFNGIFNYILIILASLIIAALCIFFIRKELKKTKVNIDDGENASR